jgi:hypothetical protein
VGLAPGQRQRDIVSAESASSARRLRHRGDEASDPELRYRMQGAAFMGAFFHVSPLAEREGLTRSALRRDRAQMQKKFGKLGERWWRTTCA